MNEINPPPLSADDAAPEPIPSRPERRAGGRTVEERRLRQQDLERAVAPGFDFFLFSLLSGLLLIPALLMDASGLYLLAVLFMPFLGPLLGMALAAPSGSLRLFVRSLSAVLLSSVFFFGAGAAAGLLANQWVGFHYDQAAYHASFGWPDLLVLAVGALFAAYSLARSPRRRPLIASVALGYELYLPAGVAGFGLTGWVPGLWPDALIVYGVHLVFGVLLAILALWTAGLRPRGFSGATILLVFLALSMGAASLLSGFSPNTRLPSWLSPGPAETPGTAASLASPSPSPTAEQKTAEITKHPTAAPSLTPTPTLQPTAEATTVPTPAPAVVTVRNGDGIFIRQQPDSGARILTSMLNGNLLWMLAEPVDIDGTRWVQVRTEDGLEGWVVYPLLSTPTPRP